MAVLALSLVYSCLLMTPLLFMEHNVQKKKKRETVDGDKADIIYVFGHQFPSSQSQ